MAGGWERVPALAGRRPLYAGRSGACAAFGRKTSRGPWTVDRGMAGRRARARRILTDVETALTTAPEQAAYERLLELLRGGNITVLSGAGLSTESGIPDYRGPDAKRRVTPMTYGEFVASPAN